MFTSYSVQLKGKSINIQIYILEPQPRKREWKITMILLNWWHWSCKRIKILWSLMELILNPSDRSGWGNSVYSYGYQVTACAQFLHWEMSTVIVYSDTSFTDNSSKFNIFKYWRLSPYFFLYFSTSFLQKIKTIKTLPKNWVKKK